VELDVRRAPDPVLSRGCDPVDPTDPPVLELAQAMVALMRTSPGCVGIAAPQVGHAVALFVLDVTGARRVASCAGLVVLCSPRLVESEGREVRREGCLSVPDLTGDVARATRVVVRGLVPGTGAERVVEADAFEARALQHELDHLEGLLFLDRVAGAHALFPRKRYL
jgi:peptide deformylase